MGYFKSVLTQLNNKIIVLLTSLLLCLPTYAHLPTDFSDFIEQIEEAEKDSPQKVITLLNQFEPNITAYSLPEQVKFFASASETYNNLGQFEKAKSYSNKGLELAKQQISPSILIAELLYSRGYAYENLGENELALADYENGVQLAISLNDQMTTAYGYVNIGAMQYLARQYEASLQTLNKARLIAEDIEDPNLKGYLYSELGILHNYIDETEEALIFYQMSVDSYMDSGQTVLASSAQLNLGSGLMDLGRYEEAIVIFKDILSKVGSEVGDRMLYFVHTRLSACYSYKKEPDYELAYQYSLNAGKYIQGTDAHDVPVFYLLERAEILYRLDRHQEVDEVLEQAQVQIPIMSKINQLFSLSHSYSIKARSYYKREQYEKALASLKLQHQISLSRFENEQQKQVNEIRMRFESEQADVTSQILNEQTAINNLALEKAQISSKFRWQVSLIISLIALIIAWAFIKLKQNQRVLLQASVTDSLTGVANRNKILMIGSKLIAENRPFSLLILDIDTLKEVNDRFGHRVGDQVIQKVAELGASSMRASDTFGRLGGEEFMVVLPDTNLAQSTEIAERLRVLIHDYTWQTIATFKPVSVSIGVADFALTPSENLEQLAKIADKNLYLAKEQGANRVCS